MTFLLDVNVLIALIDPTHISHDTTHRWFTLEGSASWATCPITENGVIRIVGSAKYPNAPGSPAIVAAVLDRLRALPGHVFWPDDISLLDREHVAAERMLGFGQVTDTYLLALAVVHGGRLATLDRRLSFSAVQDGQHALHLILTPPGAGSLQIRPGAPALAALPVLRVIVPGPLLQGLIPGAH